MTQILHLQEIVKYTMVNTLTYLKTNFKVINDFLYYIKINDV